MTRVLTAFTLEPDDPEKAVTDILKQLDLEHNLLKNTVGFLFAYIDFVNAGIVRALSARLPFDTLGCTSQGFVLPQAAGDIMLTLMVLTSDKAEFSAALSVPLPEQTDVEGCITDFYRQTAASLKGSPSVMFIFPPMLYSILAGRLLDTLDRESGGVPLFGTVAMDAGTAIRTPLSIFNGEAYENRIPLLLISGIGEFKFFLASLPGQTQFRQEAVVTSAEDNRIMDLDNEPAINYLQKFGLARGGAAGVLYAFPIEVDFHDQKPPRIFTIYDVNADGSLICSGPIPEGSTLCIGSVGSGLVIESAVYITNQIKDELADNNGKHGLFICACFSRSIVLPDPTEEMMVIQNQLRDFPLPYLFLYAGGEYCPRYTESRQTVNEFHQHTIIACLF